MRDIGKVILALVLAILLAAFLNVYGNLLFSQPSSTDIGYPLPDGSKTAAAPAAAAATAELPLPQMLAKASAANGQADAKICTTCHSLDKGGAAKVGPPLWGVVGRPKGSIAGFSYSDGMKAKGGDWTYADINTFITKPSAFVSGTKMTYPGEADAAKRADILAYLQTLSDAPVAFPK